ncbi:MULTISPECIES: hypothetical protein [Lysobacter]|uniref:hypothetical protein n=1 Tax=Lysobacter TaxID=68 RepID=UPI001F23EA73|nr:MULTISPECIES: hypothetical protein [Lysobacter]UJB18498.1 hypothetical protein L1A79_19520 [Lysobacter capsici]UJQ27777.1 hypothetical protein L2D09_20365 [Lysobacter gummosus]
MLNESSLPAVQAMRKFQFRCVAAAVRPQAVASALIVLNVLAVSACAHSPTPPRNAATTQKPNDMTSNEHYRISDAAEHPTLPPEEVGLRVLKLLENLPSLKELTAQQVIERTGLPLRLAPAAGVYGFTVRMPDSGWIYMVTFEPADSRYKERLSYEVRNPANLNDADMTPVCKLGFDAYAGALKRAGYSVSEDRNEIGMLEEYIFHRESWTVRIGTRVRSAEDIDSPACVERLTAYPAD